MVKKITKDTTLAKLFEKPELVEILVKYNLPCFGCPMARYELEELKLGEVCRIYGIDLEKLLQELNKKTKG